MVTLKLEWHRDKVELCRAYDHFTMTLNPMRGVEKTDFRCDSGRSWWTVSGRPKFAELYYENGTLAVKWDKYGEYLYVHAHDCDPEDVDEVFLKDFIDFLEEGWGRFV